MKTSSAHPRLAPDRYPPAPNAPDELWHSASGTVLVRLGGAVVAVLGDWWVLGVLGAGPYGHVLMLIGARLVVMASFIVLLVPLTSCWVGCAGSLLLGAGLLLGADGVSAAMLAPAVAMTVCYALVPLLHAIDKRRYAEAGRGMIGFLLTETERRSGRAMATIERTTAVGRIVMCLVIGLFCAWALAGFDSGHASPGSPLPFGTTVVMGLVIAGWWVRAASRRARRRLFTQPTDVHLLEWQQHGEQVLLAQPGSTRPMAYLHNPKAVNEPQPRPRTKDGNGEDPVMPKPARRQPVYVFGTLGPGCVIGLRDGAGRAWTANLSLGPDAAQLPLRPDGRTLIAPELFWELAPEAFEVDDPLVDAYIGAHAPGEPAPGRDERALDGLPTPHDGRDGQVQPAHSAAGPLAALPRPRTTMLPAALRRPVTPPGPASRTAPAEPEPAEWLSRPPSPGQPAEPEPASQPAASDAVAQPAGRIPERVANQAEQALQSAAPTGSAPAHGDDWFTPVTTWTPSSEPFSPGTSWQPTSNWEPASSPSGTHATSTWRPGAWQPSTWRPGGGAAAGWTPPGLGLGDTGKDASPAPGGSAPGDEAGAADRR
ncbi:hypothetical protein [Propionibacterium australiense]|uniref:Uncharacterized protein n=1 Tax=Propionibacterium australiense TaxID=119981 RepID=A0A383S408_9ACTN|nr:hypothetical protein [Propionibacterium australiense]RLP12582.1 hypothetical protein D9T14_01685 [Propionibacterium australiense]SYZ32593.1 Hypothetical protein PROPAUS_0481 [Propionibacterium australiense]VEH91656.1 Uncharacterised protein [Propionibacterium australiense]